MFTIKKIIALNIQLTAISSTDARGYVPLRRASDFDYNFKDAVVMPYQCHIYCCDNTKASLLPRTLL